MVTPDRGTNEGTSRGSLALQAGLVLLVGGSAALVSLQAGADAEFIALAGLAGLVLGVILTWFIIRNLREIMPDVKTPERPGR